jgi:hypothetical protein
MVFLAFALLFPRTSTARLAVAALSFSFAIEFLKLSSASWLVGARNTTWGHLIFGHVFSWQNLGAYAVGVGLGVGFEVIIFRTLRTTLAAR